MKPIKAENMDWFFGDIPSSWKVTPLKYVCSNISQYGANIPASDYVPEGVRFIRTSDITDKGNLNEGGVFVPESLVEDYVLADGDFIISRSGTVGRAFVYHVNEYPEKHAYAGYLIRYQISGRANSEFIFYLTKSKNFERWLASSATEATIGNVNGEKYANWKIPLPPLPTQRRIAAYLDEETTRIDALIKAKERLIELLEEKRQALITRAVTKDLDPDAPLQDSGVDWLGEVPVGWKVTRLKFYSQVRGGVAVGKKYRGSTLVERPYLRVANVQDGELDLTEVKKIKVSRDDAKNYLLQEGDVLMNEGGDADKLGRGCIWRGEIDNCLHQNHVFAVRPFGVTPEWLNLWTTASFSKAYFESRAKQSTNLASISSSNIKELPLLIPEKEKQHNIIAEVESKDGKLNKLIELNMKSVNLLLERRTSLITAAVTGQLTSLQ